MPVKTESTPIPTFQEMWREFRDSATPPWLNAEYNRIMHHSFMAGASCLLGKLAQLYNEDPDKAIAAIRCWADEAAEWAHQTKGQARPFEERGR